MSDAEVAAGISTSRLDPEYSDARERQRHVSVSNFASAVHHWPFLISCLAREGLLRRISLLR